MTEANEGREFTYFHNHGDDEGLNSVTICYGDPDDYPVEDTIITCEDTEEDAIECVRRLNEILKPLRDQLSERQQQLDASLRNTTRLLDQLSKERELTQTKVDYYENKLESMQRSLDMWYGDLVKEREMRKEFVEGLEGLERLFYAGYTIRPGDLNKLIKKATELDKK